MTSEKDMERAGSWRSEKGIGIVRRTLADWLDGWDEKSAISLSLLLNEPIIHSKWHVDKSCSTR